MSTRTEFLLILNAVLWITVLVYLGKQGWHLGYYPFSDTECVQFWVRACR